MITENVMYLVDFYSVEVIGAGGGRNVATLEVDPDTAEVVRLALADGVTVRVMLGGEWFDLPSDTTVTAHGEAS